MDELQYLREVEHILAEHRVFGDSAYVHDQVDLCYERRLDELCGSLPEARTVGTGLRNADAVERRRVFGDTVVRYAVKSALKQLAGAPRPGFALDECKEVLRAVCDWLEAGGSQGAGHFGAGTTVRLDTTLYHGRIWQGERGDVFTRLFCQAVKERFAHKCQPGAELAVADADDLAKLDKGLRLLDELAPTLTRSALSHVDVIALFPLTDWNGAASMSQFGVSGPVFLSRDLLSNPWWVAEHLLHEALHQKLYDFRHGHTLLEPGFARDDAPRVCSPWNIPGASRLNEWDVHRAFAAFHVYVHLAVLSAIAEERAAELEPAYGPWCARPGMTSSRKAMERAHYLGEQLRTTCQAELGLAGKWLVGWLAEVLAALDPSPPPAGATIHLLIDRYRGEARTAQTRIERTPTGSSELASDIRTLACHEVESTRSVLAEIDAAALDRFQNTIGQYRHQELAANFVQVRDLISRTILELSPGGYGVTPDNARSGLALQMVTRMVEDSSHTLHSLLAGPPIGAGREP